jgi:hypothetical protein
MNQSHDAIHIPWFSVVPKKQKPRLGPSRQKQTRDQGKGEEK